MVAMFRAPHASLKECNTVQNAMMKVQSVFQYAFAVRTANRSSSIASDAIPNGAVEGPSTVAVIIDPVFISDCYIRKGRKVYKEEILSSKCNEGTDKKIKLIATEEKYRVKLQQFTICSLKIRKLLKIGRLPKYINLSAYDKNAVRALVGYIQNENQRNITLSFYALADLIDLSRSLLMLGLLKQLENILVKMASQKTDSLLQALIIVGNERSIYGGLIVRQKIEKIAAAKFQDIVQHRLFRHIPPIIFANVIARCDLNIEKEINAVDAAIIWIWQQEKPLVNSALIFSRIRSAFLSDGDRNSIQERLKTLPNGEKMIPFIMTTLTSTFCRRCCIIKEHIDKGLIRCGIPKPRNDTAIDLRKLPLSGKLSIKQCMFSSIFHIIIFFFVVP
uniref:BACK domain-containing protein n=1 Tax=Wuchereria bancrofti TaxID=6293 RepID=A0A1I8EH35_WUCBA